MTATWDPDGNPIAGHSPATKAFAITPNDSTDLTVTPRALWVGGAGNLSVILFNDSAVVTLTGVPAGTLLPLWVRRVRSTGTTATTIVGLA